MKELFVPGGLDVSGNLVSGLTDGYAGFVKEGTIALLTDLSAVGPKDRIQIAWRVGDNIQMSMPFCAEDIASVTEIDSAAGTAQVMNITPKLPATQTKGDEYIVKVIKVTPGTADLKKKSYSIFHTGTDFTVATLIDAFVAKYGTDADMGVVFSDSTTTLTITASSVDDSYRIACDGLLDTATIVYTTPNVQSAGTYAKMVALESECESYSLGVTNKVQFPVKRRASAFTNPATTYDQTIVEIIQTSKAHHGMNATNVTRFKIYIAEDTRAGGLGEMLNDWFVLFNVIPAAVGHSHT